MKKLLSVLLLASLLFSCSKNSDDDEEEPTGTAYFKVKNETSTALENLVVGSIKNGTGTLVKNIGTLAKNGTTDEFEITDKSVTGVYFYFDLSGKTYMLTQERPVTIGVVTNITITNNSSSMEILKTDAKYPK